MPYDFWWAGESASAHGLYVEEITPPIRPATRQTRQPIPGRDGYLTIGDSALGECMRYANCYLIDYGYRDGVLAWLRGTGNVVFGTDPDRYCKATVLDQLAFVDEKPGNSLIVAFACQPYRYIHPSPPTQTFTASPGSINNPGTAEAEPIITVVGSGDITLTIGSKSVTVTGLASSITIDVPAGRAYNGTTALDSTVSRDAFPLTIPPGISAVSWTGTVTSVSIQPNWRYI